MRTQTTRKPKIDEAQPDRAHVLPQREPATYTEKPWTHRRHGQGMYLKNPSKNIGRESERTRKTKGRQDRKKSCAMEEYATSRRRRDGYGSSSGDNTSSEDSDSEGSARTTRTPYSMVQVRALQTGRGITVGSINGSGRREDDIPAGQRTRSRGGRRQGGSSSSTTSSSSSSSGSMMDDTRRDEHWNTAMEQQETRRQTNDRRSGKRCSLCGSGSTTTTNVH